MKSQELRCWLQHIYGLGSSILTKRFEPNLQFVLLIGNVAYLLESVTSNPLISAFYDHT